VLLASPWPNCCNATGGNRFDEIYLHGSIAGIQLAAIDSVHSVRPNPAAVRPLVAIDSMKRIELQDSIAGTQQAAIDSVLLVSPWPNCCNATSGNRSNEIYLHSSIAGIPFAAIDSAHSVNPNPAAVRPLATIDSMKLI
jgi:hypothetical protein